MTEPTFTSIAQIKDANRRAGQHFFDKESMRFFDSKIASTVVWAGRYFITSEQFRAHGFSGIVDGPRCFTIREVQSDGQIDTVGDFQAYRYLEDARRAVKALAKAARITE